MANLEALIIHGPGRPQSLRTNVLTEELTDQLDHEFASNPPAWHVKGSEWPLREAFDALGLHFSSATIGFNPSLDAGRKPSASQFLELAKSIWIIEVIKKSDLFRSIGTDSIWAQRMRQLEGDLRGQLHRFEAGELEKPSLEEIRKLPKSSWLISSRDEGHQDDPLQAGEAQPYEVKTLEVQLSSNATNRESSLMVFNEDDTNFRVVTSEKQADTLVTQYDHDMEVNLDRHRLVPAYANPLLTSAPCQNILLFNERGRNAKEFIFRTHDDVLKFQRAFTGYRVHHDMPIRRWCINSSGKPGEFGRGAIQMWQYKPLPAVPPRLNSASDAASSIKSPHQGFELGADSPPATGTACSPSGPPADLDRDIISNGFPWMPLAQVSEGGTFQGLPYDEPARRLTTFSGTTVREDASVPSVNTSLYRKFSDTPASPASRHERRRSSVVSGTTMASRNSLVSAVRGPRGNGTELSTPVDPALIIFTHWEGKFSYVYLSRKLSLKRVYPHGLLTDLQ